jgi:hypothetical protein
MRISPMGIGSSSGARWPSSGLGSRGAAEADAEQVAVDGDVAVVGLAGVLADAVPEAVEGDVAASTAAAVAASLVRA